MNRPAGRTREDDFAHLTLDELFTELFERTRDALDEDTARLLRLTADRAAVAAEQARLFEAERESSEQLRKLESVTDAALANLALDDLLSELLERIRDVLQTDTAAVLLLDERTNELVARAAKGLEEEVERGTRIPLGRGFAGRIAAERRPVTIDDVDHADVLNPILREKGVKSLLGAPLVARGRVLGVLHVGTLSARRFERRDVELLQRAADRTALALERALVHEDLLRLDHLRDRFVSTASHELRTPASAILGVAATLTARAETLSPEQENALKEILREQAERLARLIDQLLDLSRIEARALAVAPERFRLRDRLETAVGDSSPDGEVRIECPLDLEVVVDPVAVERIVSNLVANALLHGEPPVTVRAAAENGSLTIEVEDRGSGIPPEFRSRLFEQFARADDATGRPGSGLGLAIARSYARANEGEVSYEDAEPRGSRFALVLPTEPA